MINISKSNNIKPNVIVEWTVHDYRFHITRDFIVGINSKDETNFTISRKVFRNILQWYLYPDMPVTGIDDYINRHSIDIKPVTFFVQGLALVICVRSIEDGHNITTLIVALGRTEAEDLYNFLNGEPVIENGITYILSPDE